MRIALSGVSHWHTPLYAEPASRIPGNVLVGVADPDLERARQVADTYACRAYDDLAEMVRAEQPDFVFVLGSHASMADATTRLIDLGIPCAVEKPAGVSLDQVSELAARARKNDAFVAVPLVFRNGPLFRLVSERFQSDPADYASFRFIAGSSQRYVESGCDWMLRESEAGGGCLTNLGVHFLDMIAALALTGTTAAGDIDVVSAVTRNHLGLGDVEDFAAVTLAGPGGFATVEVGYLYSAGHGEFDMHFAIRSPSCFLSVAGPTSVHLTSPNGTEVLEMATTNVPCYPDFVVDTLTRVGEGRPPLASMDEMLVVMQLLDKVYSAARKGRTPRGA